MEKTIIRNKIVDAQKDYLLRNDLGFEGDFILKETIEKIVKDNDVEAIIETGTYRGSTTLQFSKMVKIVHTIEASSDYFNESKKKLQFVQNVVQYLGKSEDIFEDVVSLCKRRNLLLFLDAHWFNSCPLIDELKAVARLKLKPIILIHDFKVPGTDFGFDSYNGQDFTIEWLRPHLEAIYGQDFKYFYNTKAEGARRGVLFVNCG